MCSACSKKAVSICSGLPMVLTVILAFVPPCWAAKRFYYETEMFIDSTLFEEVQYELFQVQIRNVSLGNLL